MNRLTLLLTLFVFGSACTCVRAQAVQISVIVPNPPPARWEAYLEFEADILIVLTNTGTTTRELKLVPTLTSDRGLSASFVPGFQPLAPLILGPTETLTLTYRDLRGLFGMPTQSDIDLEGIDFNRLLASETIPEGSYTLCVEVRDFLTDRPVSTNAGCAFFFVRQYEPPVIMWPMDQTLVPPTEPQFLNFLWSITGMPGRTRYRFALYDLDELGLFNPADAVLLDAVRPWFETDELMGNSLAYDLSLPPLTEGHRYAVQVIAYDPESNQLFAQGGRSTVHTFEYAAPVTGGNDDPPEPTFNTVDCASPAEPVPPPIPYPTISIGQQISFGGFPLEVLSGGGAAPASGRGRLLLESLNMSVEVDFGNLYVNAEGQAWGEDAFARAVVSGPVPGPVISEVQALALSDEVTANDRWVDSQVGSPVALTALPAGLAGAGMDLLLTGLEVSVTGARGDLLAVVELSEAPGRRLLLVGPDLCLNGLTPWENAELRLAEDESFPLSPGLQMTFLAAAAGGTSARWSESGIEEIDVAMDLTFANTLVPTNGAPFVARVTATAQDYDDWIGTVSVESAGADAVPMEDFSFNYEKIEFEYDHSTVRNPSGMTLPVSHSDHNYPNLWQGLYLADTDLRFPPGFDVEIAVGQTLLDAEGIWMDVDLSGNLLDISEGEIGGWAVGIDGLRLDIQGTRLEEATFDGRVRLPVSPTQIAFTAPLGGSESIEVALSPGTDLEVDMFLADLELLGNSSVRFTPQGDTYLPQAILNGSLSVGWAEGANGQNNGVPSFNLPTIDFQDFTITGGAGPPTLSGTFSLDAPGLPQGTLAGFPLSLSDEITFGNAGGEVSLQLPLQLRMVPIANGFEAAATFRVVSEWVPGQRRFRYQRTELGALSVDAELGVCTLEAAIELFDDPAFGRGFDGTAAVTFAHLGIGAEMQLIVGRNDDYRYFMIDALARFPGVPLGPSGLGLFGLGGGFYYNMDRDFNAGTVLTINDIDLPEPAAGDTDGISTFSATRGQSASPGVSYAPDEGTFGFSASIVLGMMPTTAAFNADLEFGMEISGEFGLQEMWMSGSGYALQAMDSRGGNALISGTVDMVITPPERRFELLGTLSANVANFLTYSIELDALYSPDRYHFYLGKWTPGYQFGSDPGRNVSSAQFDFGFASASTGTYSYFMMGNDITPGLPDRPGEIVDIFDEHPEEGTLINAGPGSAATTSGFAFGMVNEFNLSFRASIFRLDARYFLGMDIIMADLGGQQCSESNFGINNWYAGGEAYAYLGVAGSVEGKLFGRTRKFEFASIEAAAKLQFRGPKPTWIKGRAALKGRALGGLVRFDTKVGFEFGKRVECSTGSGNIFDDIPIVEDWDPTSGATNRSVFTDPTATFNFPRGVFPIVEEQDDGSREVVYYSYAMNPLQIKYRLPGEDGWRNYTGTILGPNYDQAGYSARFDQKQLFPDHAEIELSLEAWGRRHGSDNSNDIAETFTAKVYKRRFTVGVAPDYVLPGSIDNAKPFPAQRHFFRNEGGDGFWSIWTDRISPEVFRSSPRPTDDLDPAGRFRYRIRYRDLAAGTQRDVVPTRLDAREGGEIRFPIPSGWLQPEKIYEMDLMRIYVPPQQRELDDNTVVELTNMSTAANPDFTVVNSFTFSRNTDTNAGNGNATSGLSNNVSLHTAAGRGNTFGVLDTNEPDPPAPEGLSPTFAGTTPGGPDIGDFRAPGGDMTDIKYQARKVRSRGRVSNNIVTSILPAKLHFRTSKYGTRAEKIATVTVKQLSGDETPTRSLYVAPDPNNNESGGVYVDCPIFFLDSGEPFDRFEAQHYTEYFVVTHLEESSEVHDVTFYPAFSFAGDQDNWLYNGFAGSDGPGLRKRPFHNSPLRAWCDTYFQDPDGPGFLNPPVQDEDADNQLNNTHNPPLHVYTADETRALYPLEPYLIAGPNGTEEYSERRIGGRVDYAVNRTGRRYPLTTFPEGSRWELPTVDFVRFSDLTLLPSWTQGLSVKVQNTYRKLSPSEIGNARQMGEGFYGVVAGGIHDYNILPPKSYIPVLDYTEYIAVSDYIRYRRLIHEGTTELAIFSETVDNPSLDHLYNFSTDPECDLPPGPIPGHPDFHDQTANYNYFLQYDKPIRSWLRYELYYPSRPASTLEFFFEGKPLSTYLPALNQDFD